MNEIKVVKNLAQKFQAWYFETYGELCAMTKVDIMETLKDGQEYRRTYTLMFHVKPVKKGEPGVDNEGSRASGGADAVVISAYREAKISYTVVKAGDIISTPFGMYLIEWASKTNHDHLKLTEVKMKKGSVQ